MTDHIEAAALLPLQYIDGPDYCTVKDARGADFALTMQPEIMKAMEAALRRPAASGDLRERIARIIDPYAWSAPENMTPTERALFEHTNAARRHNAFSKADEIASLPSRDEEAIRVEPTPAQVNSACMSYRHDFGLLSEAERSRVQFEAREWLHAWQKEGIGANRNEIIERCAAEVDQANREGPYQAIAAASRIRSLKTESGS